MSTIEPPLTDAELRYVRAAVKLAASYKTVAGVLVDCDREQLPRYIEAAVAAPPGAIPVVLWKRNREQPRLTWDDHGTPATVAGEADIAAWLAWRVLCGGGRQVQEARSA